MYQIRLLEHGTEAGRMGDYSVRKVYDILDQSGKRAKVSGSVVQLVTKQSHADTSQGPLDTTDAFSKFTCGQVNYMCDSYIELFEIRGGRSKDADAFASGSVSVCEDGELVIVEPPYEPDDEPFKTSGTITHTGTNVFFSAKIPDLMKLPWRMEDPSPANGLLTLPASYWQQILSLGNESSNIPVHTVTVTWKKDMNESVVNSTFTNNVALRKGGRSRKTHRKYSKRASRKRNRK